MRALLNLIESNSRSRIGKHNMQDSIRRVFNIASMLSSGDVLLNSREDDRDDVVRCSRLVHKSGDHFTYDSY